ncbi:MAG: class E sortase [bacterium]|nr:class E sortase [bacterium]
MFSTSATLIHEERGPVVSANLFLTILPIILFVAFIAGATTFLFGQDPPATTNERHAKLPVAGDRFITGSQLKAVAGIPLVAYAAKPTNPLTAVRTAEDGNWVRIPALKVNVPVSEAMSMQDKDVLNTLATGVAMYPNGVHPGENGNVFIAGHSTGEPWKGPYRFAFMNINKLKPDDTILIDYNGNRYTYVITDSRIINPQDTRFIESTGSAPTLSLMACWPLWTAKNRMIIESKLVTINPLIIIK